MRISSRTTFIPELDEDGDDSDSESDPMDQSSSQNPLIETSISLLNSAEFVSGIVSIAEGSNARGSAPTFSGSPAPLLKIGNTENIRNICKICHQLLIHNQQVFSFVIL